jgi:hypothetical protein
MSTWTVKMMKAKLNLVASKAEVATMEKSMVKKSNKKSKLKLIKRARKPIKIKKMEQDLPTMRISHTC